MRLTFFIIISLIIIPYITYAQMECPVDKIYPQSADFSGDDCGRILINNPTGSFYTSYQREEGQIRIKAVLGSEYVGQAVYFKIIDPDDMSPYETDLDGDDNGDKMGYSLISHNTTVNVVDQTGHIYSTIAQEAIETEESIAVAEVILKFTDHYSGDNYKVLCNTDSTVPIGNSAETVCMVAWKRQGLAKYFMYKNGSWLYENHSAGELTIRSSCFDYDPNLPQFSDFSVGDQVVVWGNSDSGNYSEIKNIQDIEILYSPPPFPNIRYAITFTEPLENSFNRFSGIRRISEDDVYSFVEEESFKMDAYGKSTCGRDGGAFIEYQVLVPEEPIIFPSADFNCVSLPHTANGFMLPEQNNWELYKNFQEYWFDGNYEGTDIFAVTCARRSHNNQRGRSEHSNNSVSLYCQNLEETSYINYDIVANSVLIHEIGHQFKIDNDHVDTQNYVQNHENSDICIINWDDCGNICHYANKIVEFDVVEEEENCLYQIRKQNKGL